MCKTNLTEDMVLVTETRAEAVKRERDTMKWDSACWVCVPCRLSFNRSDLRIQFKERCVLPHEHSSSVKEAAGEYIWGVLCS